MLLAFAVPLLFFIKGRDGRPLVSFDRIRTTKLSMPELPDLKDLTEKVKQPFSKAPKDKKVDLYKRS